MEQKKNYKKPQSKEVKLEMGKPLMDSGDESGL